MKPRTEIESREKTRAKTKRASILTAELKAAWRDAFGAEVRRRRRARRMTIEALARRSRLSAAFVGLVEVGKREPSLSTVIAVATGLGVEPYELFGGSLTPAALELALGYDRIEDEAVRTAIVKVLRSVEQARSKPAKSTK